MTPRWTASGAAEPRAAPDQLALALVVDASEAGRAVLQRGQPARPTCARIAPSTRSTLVIDPTRRPRRPRWVPAGRHPGRPEHRAGGGARRTAQALELALRQLPTADRTPAARALHVGSDAGEPAADLVGG